MMHSSCAFAMTSGSDSAGLFEEDAAREDLAEEMQALQGCPPRHLDFFFRHDSVEKREVQREEKERRSDWQ